MKRGDIPAAIRELTPPAEAGSVSAQLALGSAMLLPGRARDFRQAYRWLLAAAEKGSPEAMFLVGNMVLSGRGTRSDPGRAAAWFERSAKLGFGRSQACLGHLYWAGRGVPRDDEESVKWYRRAAEHRNLHAYLALALAASRGAGTLPNPVQALTWWYLAASRGDPHIAALRDAAIRNLMLTPKDVARAESAARKWQARYGGTLDDSPLFLFEQ